jgi:hypothetical protein
MGLQQEFVSIYINLNSAEVTHKDSEHAYPLDMPHHRTSANNAPLNASAACR